MKFVGKVLLLCSMLVLAGSCTKIQESPDPGTSTNNTGSGGSTGGGSTGGSTTVHLTCKIDGTSYEATTFDGKVLMGTLSLNTFPQAAWSFPNVGISAPESVSTGTYSPGQGVTIIYSESADPSGIYNLMPSGSIVVSSHDVTKKEIKGTFACTVKNLLSGGSKEITEGSFYLTYQ